MKDPTADCLLCRGDIGAFLRMGMRDRAEGIYRMPEPLCGYHEMTFNEFNPHYADRGRVRNEIE